MTRELDEDDANSIVEALEAMPETCALDVAARGGSSTYEIGALLNVCSDGRQGISEQIRRATAKLRERCSVEDFEEQPHPEDFYVRYSEMGAAELAELAATLRKNAKR